MTTQGNMIYRVKGPDAGRDDGRSERERAVGKNNQGMCAPPIALRAMGHPDLA